MLAYPAIDDGCYGAIDSGGNVNISSAALQWWSASDRERSN